ncbi:MAG: C40 family peptidase [Polaromonas sp.]|nr:C40 family peptidase [Polaromonas sp.]
MHVYADSPQTNTAVATTQNDEITNLLENKGLFKQIGGQIAQSTQHLVHVGQSVTQSVGERTSELVSTAIGFLGVPYRFGGNTAESGFDCSGFVRSVFKDAVGFVLPRSSVEQANATQRIDKDDLKAGDLVFFNTMKRAFSHVGVYLGEGKFIHSPRAGGQVRVEDMRVPYWNVRFDGAVHKLRYSFKHKNQNKTASHSVKLKKSFTSANSH